MAFGMTAACSTLCLGVCVFVCTHKHIIISVLDLKVSNFELILPEPNSNFSPKTMPNMFFCFSLLLVWSLTHFVLDEKWENCKTTSHSLPCVHSHRNDHTDTHTASAAFIKQWLNDYLCVTCLGDICKEQFKTVKMRHFTYCGRYKFTESIYTTGAAHHSTGKCTHLHTKLYTPLPPPCAGVGRLTKSKM